MDLGIAGRTALVCGGSSGLGYAVAGALLAEGATVAVNGRTPDKLARAVEQLRREHPGARVEGLPADVAVPAEAAGLVAAAHERLGGPDILLCNSGGPPAGPFDSHPPERWQEALDLCLLSAIHLCRAALPHMRAARWGRILCLTSIAARQPSQGLILSTTARAGVLGFAKSLADEVARDGITVNVLCPGYFGTERLEELASVRAGLQGTTPVAVLEDMGRTVPAGRLGRPEEFAAAVAFLASEPARYITGSVLGVDGGLARSIL